jgi:hypothetical protein
MKTYGRVDVQIHIFLTSALVGGEWSASRSGRFTPGERSSGTNCIGGWVDPRAGLDDMEKRKYLSLPELELRPIRSPSRSQSLYRLSYPDSQYFWYCIRMVYYHIQIFVMLLPLKHWLSKSNSWTPEPLRYADSQRNHLENVCIRRMSLLLAFWCLATHQGSSEREIWKWRSCPTLTNGRLSLVR